MTDSHIMDEQADGNLLHSFGLASFLVVAGVLAGAFLLSREGAPVNLVLPALPQLTWSTQQETTAGSQSWLDLADSAFAAGRVTAPVTDNALYYYHQALQTNGEDERASSGMNRVIAYVLGEAENAVYEGDWTRAREGAEKILAVAPGHTDATSVLERSARFERAEDLARLAVNQLATDRLLAPKGDNALHSYEQILALDPTNNDASVGIKTIAQRLLAKSQSAAYEGNFDASATYLRQARNVAPDLAGLDGAVKMTNEFARLSQEKAAEASLAEQSEAPLVRARPQAEAPVAAAAPMPAVDRVFSVSELKIQRNPAPVFPRRAEAAEKDGWVELNFRVDDRGAVYDVEVVRSSDRVFESSALAAMRRWRFEPQIENGVAVPVRSGIRFAFQQ